MGGVGDEKRGKERIGKKRKGDKKRRTDAVVELLQPTRVHLKRPLDTLLAMALLFSLALAFALAVHCTCRTISAFLVTARQVLFRSIEKVCRSNFQEITRLSQNVS